MKKAIAMKVLFFTLFFICTNSFASRGHSSRAELTICPLGVITYYPLKSTCDLNHSDCLEIPDGFNCEIFSEVLIEGVYSMVLDLAKVPIWEAKEAIRISRINKIKQAMPVWKTQAVNAIKNWDTITSAQQKSILKALVKIFIKNQIDLTDI